MTTLTTRPQDLYRTGEELPILNYGLLRDLVLWAAADHDDIEELKAKFEQWGSWNQDVWAEFDPEEIVGRAKDALDVGRNDACGTAFCMAGQAVVQSGYALVFENADEADGGTYLAADMCAPAIVVAHDKQGKPIYGVDPQRDEDEDEQIESKGRDVIGLSHMEAGTLFNGDNDIERIVTIAAVICEARGLDLEVPVKVENHIDEDERYYIADRIYGVDYANRTYAQS